MTRKRVCDFAEKLDQNFYSLWNSYKEYRRELLSTIDKATLTPSMNDFSKQSILDYYYTKI